MTALKITLLNNCFSLLGKISSNNKTILVKNSLDFNYNFHKVDMVKSQDQEHIFSDVKKNIFFDLNQESFNFIKANLLNFDYYFFKAYSMSPWYAIPITRRREGV